jgi:hypothetical protein
MIMAQIHKDNLRIDLSGQRKSRVTIDGNIGLTGGNSAHVLGQHSGAAHGGIQNHDPLKVGSHLLN